MVNGDYNGHVSNDKPDNPRSKLFPTFDSNT